MIRNEPPETFDGECPKCGEYMEIVYGHQYDYLECAVCGHQIRPKTCASCDSLLKANEVEFCRVCQEAEDRAYYEEMDIDPLASWNLEEDSQ